MKIGAIYGEDKLVPSADCFSCHRPITGVVVWLGETYNGVAEEWPFHPTCADGPWPLYETRRSVNEPQLQTVDPVRQTEDHESGEK